MVEMKKVSAVAMQDLLQAWNEGWQGYFVNMTMDMNKLLRRFPVEHLEADLSYIAYDGDKPVGFVLNGVREINGELVSWNGGTAVNPEYRKKGIGRQLIAKALELYKEQNVTVARLEAIFENDKAIELYKSMGYVTFEHLAHIQYNQVSSEPTLAERIKELVALENSKQSFNIAPAAPGHLADLELYRNNAPWQAQWFSINQPEALIIKVHSDKPIGYMLYNQVKNPYGALVGVNIYQFEVLKDDALSEKEVILYGLAKLVEQFQAGTKMTAAYISENNQTLNTLLYALGFKTFARQVHMEKAL